MASSALADSNITWTNLAPYAVAQGNGVKKNSGPSDWVCGPYSNESIASGDFYIEFPVNETNKHRHLGFSANPGATNNYYSLTASIRVQADAKAYSYIGSGSATFLGTVIVGTKLGIQVVGGTVTFFRDDVEVGNSYTPAITYPVHVDTCLHTNEGSFTDVMFGSGLPGGGAIMNQALANDPDDADNLYGAGDSIIISFDADTGSPTGSVDSLFSFNQSIGNSYSGSWNGSGDVYTITINTPAANAPQRTATIISGLGDLDGASAELLGDWGGRPVTWSSVTNLNPGANGSITKSGPTSDWNAGAVSNVAVLEQLGAFGFVEARVTHTNKKLAFGLSKGNTGTSYSEMDFALFAGSDGALRVYESNVEKDNNGAYQAGDLLRMEVDPADNKLHYFRNDVEFYVSTVTLTAANFPLLVDLAMESIGGEITVPRINLPQPLPPIAVADAVTIAEDTVAMGNVLTNDSAREGQAITAALDDNVASGSVRLLPDGSFTYTPNADFNGADSFTYHCSDGALSSTVTTVSITVTAVNDPPVAFDDVYATLEDTQLSVSAATGVSLPNDMDADADSLTVTLLSGVSKGILSLASDGSFVYDPAPNQPLSGNEIISFSYTLSDGEFSATATARITVTAVNDPPMLLPPNYYVYTQPGQSVQLERPVVSVLDPDGDGSSATFVHGDSANPRVTISNGGTTVTYNPAVFIGLDTVELKARDTANVNSPNAYITVMVAPPGGEEEEVQTNQIAAYDRFGFRAAMAGTWALIGADRNDSYGDNAGKVFVYQQNAQNVWVQQGDLYPAMAPQDGQDGFGFAVAMAGDLAIVGSPFVEEPLVFNCGAANVFRLVEGVWTHEQYLCPPDLVPYEVFGAAVDTDGTRLLVGTLETGSNGNFAAEPARVFEHNGSIWVETASLLPAGQPNATSYAEAVSISGDWAAVAAHKANTNAGEVHLFERLANGTWEHRQTLTAPSTGFHFGSALDLDASKLLVGHSGDSAQAYAGGAAHLYALDTGIWSLTTSIRAADQAAYDYGGGSVSLSGDIATIGAREHDLASGNQAGAAYAFRGAGEIGKFSPAALLAADYFGSAVATNGEYVVVGADGDDGAGAEAGTAYFFALPPTSQDASYTIGQPRELTFPLSDLTDGPAIDYDDADIVGALTLGLNDIYTYIPVNDFVGSDVFTFVGDRFGAHSVESTVTIHVFEVPQPPVAVDDSDITAEDNPVTLDLLVNDTDPNAGDTLTITIVDPPQNGSTSRDENDNVVYLPNADYEGPDTFTYRLSDGMFESNVATVFLTVTPVNDAPVAINDSVVILEDRVAVGNVRDNDSDDDSPEASLSVSLIDDVGQGSLTLNADGSFDYTPNADFIGVDHFSYELSDGDKQAIASVTILILNAFDNLIAFAQDPDDADDILSQDDTLTLVFESETNMPLGPDLDKTEVDQLIDFRGQSLGADYSGWWETPRTLVLTVDDATGGDLDITKVIGVHSGQGLEYTSNETLLPEDAMVQGDWGTGGIEIEIGGDVDRDGDVDDTDYGLGMNGPGLLIPYNGDDDNGNESRDLHDAGPVTDDDLVEVYLLLGADPGPLTGTATLQISSPPGAGAVAVWRDADKTNLLFRSNEPIHSADFDLGAGASLPSSIYLEGLDGSAVAGDLLLTLTYVDNDHSHSRYQHLTVVQVGWEVDLDEDGDIDDDDELRENDGDGLFVELGHTRNVGVVAKPSNLALGHIRLTIDSGTAVVDILSSGGSSILDGVLGQELPHALDSQLTLEQAIDSVVGAYGATQGNFFGDSRILIEFLHETHTLQRDSMNYSVFSADPANSIDIDIDSNNDGVVDSADDLIEDQAAHSGQFLRLNDRDLDSNGQPDWFDAKFGVDVTQPRLTKVYLSISPNVDLTGATLRFDYDAEDPANGDDSTPGYFHPNDDGSWGKLRLYDGQGGFIPSNAAGDIQFDIPVASLGFGNARTQILYLEAIDGSGSFGDAGITVSLIFDNMAVPASSDTILATSYRTRLLNRDDSGPFAAPSFQPRTVLVNRANTFTQSGIDPPDYADLHGSERFTDVNFIFGEELADAHDPLIEILATNQSDPVAVANLSPGDDFTPAPGAYRLWSEDGWRSRDHLPYATSGDWVENGTVLNRNQYPSAHFLYSAGDHGIGLFVEGVRDGVETITARMHLAGAPFDEAETTVAIHNFGMILEHNNSSSNVAAVRKTRQVLAASSADPTFTIPPQTTPHSSDRVAKITWSTEIPADGKMEIRVVRVEGEDDISVEKDDAGTDLTPKNWDLDKTKEPTPIPMPMTIYASGNSAGEHKISLWYQEAPKTFDDEIITSEPYMVDERIITVEAAIASITAFKAVPKGCSRVVSVDVTTGVEWTFKIDGGRAKITGHESSTITPVDSLTITPTASPVTIEITGTEADAAVDDSKLIAEFAGANIAEEDFTVVDVLLPSVTAIPVNGTISLSATVSPANPGIDIEFEVSTDAEFVPSASTKTIPDPPGSVSLEIKGLSASPAADDAELSVKIDGIACGIERFTVIGVTLPEIAPIVVGQEREVIVSFSPKAAGVELGLQLVNNDMATDPPKATNEATSKAGYVTDPAEDPRPSLQTFDSGDDDQTLIIAGQTASADAGDVSLALIVDGEILDASPFTVIEVNVPAIGRMIPRRINAEYYEISVFPVLPDGVSLELVLERIGGTEGVAVFISDDDELSSITVEGSEPSVQIAGIEQSLGMLNNIRLSASLSMDGTPCDSVDFTIAAHPVNFRLDSHSKTGLEWETLLLAYLWDSDSGVLEDLDKVWVGEYVSYDNWGQPPNPPWRGIFEDPTISPPRYSRNGSDGGLYDFHTPPGNLLPVSVPNDEFVATQNYGFRDFRTNPGTNNSFELLWQSHILGPLEIIRKVESGRYYLRKPSVPDGVISVILP